MKWLKLHLVSLTGKHKLSSNETRLEFAETLLNKAIDSAKDPFQGKDLIINGNLKIDYSNLKVNERFKGQKKSQRVNGRLMDNL